MGAYTLIIQVKVKLLHLKKLNQTNKKQESLAENRSFLIDQNYLTIGKKDLVLFSHVQKKARVYKAVLTAYNLMRGSQEGPLAHQMQSK